MENKLISFTITFGLYCFLFVFFNLYRIDKENESQSLNAYCDVEIKEIVVEEQKINHNKSGDIKNKTQSTDDKRKIDNEKSKDQKTTTTPSNEISQSIPETKHIDNTHITNNNTPGSDFKYEGNVMVQWNLDNRTPHNNDSWNIRNPGYMCGFNQDGVLYIEITVDDVGNVIKTNINKDKSYNLTNCIISNGLEYAKKSKFSPGKNKQRGYIIYKFIGQ